MNRFTRIGKLVCLALALTFALGTALAETCLLYTSSCV